MQTNQETGNMHTEALEWLALGIATVPCQRGAKTPAIQWGRYQRQLPTLRDLGFWYARPRNLAVLGGRGLVVLDFDDLAVYDQVMTQNHELAELAERTYKVLTSRGVHVYLFVDEPVRTQHLGGLDVIGSGGYVIGAGSVHPSGALYTALGDKTAIQRVATLPPILSNPVSTRSDCGLLSIDRATATRTREPLDVLDNPPAELGYDPLGRVLARFRASDFLTTPITPSGPGWGLALCPLHDDHHPSLLVNMRRGDVRCLAGCNSSRWMDAVRLYGLLHGLSDKEAVRELARQA